MGEMMKKEEIVRTLVAIALTTVFVVACEKNVNHSTNAVGENDARQMESMDSMPQDYFGKGAIGEFDVYVVSDNAKIYEDTLSPLNGRYTGDFVLEVFKDNKLTDSQKINFDDNEVYFSKGFTINKVDYNDDGKDDFAIGNYMSSNYDIYNFYSLSLDGKIELLYDQDGNKATVLADKMGESPKFSAKNKELEYDYYDMHKGKHTKKVLKLK